MGAFGEVLRGVAGPVPEAVLLLILGTDGIPVERLDIGGDANLEAAAAEYTTLLRATLAAGADTHLGELHELTVATERMTAMLIAITPEYFLFAALRPGAFEGRARHALRMAASSLLA